MGQPQVGKTSIIRSYMESVSMEGRNVARTLTLEDFSKIEEIKLDDGSTHRVHLKIWDAAGDASVKNVAPLFLKNVSCCVFVYSINSSHSFKGLDEWHEAFTDYDDKNAMSVLVGNKSDLEDHRTVPVVNG